MKRKMSKILRKTMTKHSKSLNFEEYTDLENRLLEKAQNSLQELDKKIESEAD